MRRLALALLLFASTASAAPTGSLLVVEPDYSAAAGQVGQNEVRNSMRRFSEITKDILSSLGVDFSVVTTRQVKAEFVRTGTMVWDYGKASARAESFDAVLQISPQLINLGAGFLRADSVLNKTRRGPTVPQLLLFSDYDPGSTSTQLAATACSIGVEDAFANPGAPNMMWKIGETKAFQTAGHYNAGAIPNGDATIRKLIAYGTGSYPNRPRQNNVMCSHCDSVNFANTDTLVMWELPEIVSGASAVVCAIADGVGSPYDSVSNLDGNVARDAAEVDRSIILMALARLDSLSGGALFDKDRLPLKVAVTVDGAFRWESTGRRAGPSILAADSSVFKATLDSLAAINAAGGVMIKLTVGAVADSVAERGFERAWWDVLGGQVRFSPQNWFRAYGLTTAQAGAGTASTSRPIDIWGQNRSRVIFGDYGGVDTSLVSLLANGRRLITETFGIERTSHFALPVMDCWAPSNKKGAANFDSVLYAIWKAGFVGVRADGRSWAGSPATMRNGTSMLSATPYGSSTLGGPLGYTNVEGVYRESIGGFKVKVLRHNGYPIIGAVREWVTFADSAAPIYSADYYGAILIEMTRTWIGLFGRAETADADSWPQDAGFFQADSWSEFEPFVDTYFPIVDMERCPVPAKIRKFNVADFSGVANGPPARHAYWTLKWVKNAFDATNAFANRTVCDFAWPEDITP